MMSKGSRNRTHDHDAYGKNFDRIMRNEHRRKRRALEEQDAGMSVEDFHAVFDGFYKNRKRSNGKGT